MGHRNDIDGLRAVAVIVVVMFHAFPGVLPGGFVGVDVFFVISGYVITTSILNDLATGRFSLKGFYARRVRRIFPALIVVLLVTLAAGWFVLFPADFSQLGRHALASALFAPNFIFWNEVGYFDVDASMKPLLHLWSLGIEEQFYLVWPALIVLLTMRRRYMAPAVALLIALSFAYCVYAGVKHPAAAFYSPLSRFWELGIGGLLALWGGRAPSWVSYLGLALISVSVFALNETDPRPALYALPPVAGAAMVVVGNNALLASTPMSAFGRVSYPLYLWHWPLLSFAGIAGANSGGVRAGAVLVALVLAIATYQFVERPIRYGAFFQFSVAPGFRARAVPGGIAGMATVGLFAAVIMAAGGFPLRYPADIQPVIAMGEMTAMERAEAGGRLPSCWLYDEMTFDDYADECREGSTLIWGDSHAAMLYAGFADVFGSVAQFTRSACRPYQMKERNPCSDGNRAILAEIDRLKPERVILFAAWYRHWTEWDKAWPYAAEFSDIIRALHASGVRDVVVIGPAPFWDPVLPVAVHSYWQANGVLPDRLPPQQLQYGLADATLAAIARDEGARFISLVENLCDGRGCLTHTQHSQSELLFWDYGHFTEDGARFVVPLIFNSAGR